MQFYGQWNADKFIFERYFPDKRNGFFVEAGAFDGITECSCKFFEESMGWRGFNIEPVPFLFKILQQNRPLSQNIHCALAEKDGKAIFRQALHPERGCWFGNGSIRHVPEHLDELAGCSFDEFEVETRAYSSLTNVPSIPVPDLMVLDVEGYEIDVLKGMMGSSNLPKVMCVEFRPNKLDDITGVMRSMGYEFDTIYYNNAYYRSKVP